MVIDKRIYNLIYLIVFLICLFVGYQIILHFTEKVSSFDEQKMKRSIDSLHNQNEQLILKISGYENSIKGFQNKIDSLENLKQEIKVIYVRKKNKIDSASSSVIISEYNDIFTKNSVK